MNVKAKQDVCKRSAREMLIRNCWQTVKWCLVSGDGYCDLLVFSIIFTNKRLDKIYLSNFKILHEINNEKNKSKHFIHI